MQLPAPRLLQHDRFFVLRDDLLPGGTKRRVLNKILTSVSETEVVYGACQYGQGHIALAYACRDLGKQATLFYPSYESFSSSFYMASKLLGAKYYLTDKDASQVEVAEAAHEYALRVGAKYFPVGFAFPEFRDCLAEIARQLPIVPEEVWALAGSGTLVRSLCLAWPDATIKAVSLGLPHCDTNGISLYEAPETVGEAAEIPPPYPSSECYDAKIWRFAKRLGAPGALIWNVS